jgi:hypothetical protein
MNILFTEGRQKILFLSDGERFLTAGKTGPKEEKKTNSVS